MRAKPEDTLPGQERYAQQRHSWSAAAQLLRHCIRRSRLAAVFQIIFRRFIKHPLALGPHIDRRCLQ